MKINYCWGDANMKSSPMSLFEKFIKGSLWFPICNSCLSKELYLEEKYTSKAI